MYKKMCTFKNVRLSKNTSSKISLRSLLAFDRLSAKKTTRMKVYVFVNEQTHQIETDNVAGSRAAAYETKLSL